MPGSADALRGLRILEYRRQDKAQQAKDREAVRLADPPPRHHAAPAPQEESGKGGEGGKGQGLGKGAPRAGNYYGSGDGGGGRLPRTRRSPGGDVLRITN